MTDYAEYDDLDEDDRAAELADLSARMAALSGGVVADATVPPQQVTAQPEPEGFDAEAHAANVASLVNANYASAEDYYAAAAARGLLHEEAPPVMAPSPSDAAKAACLEEGLSEAEFWRRANAAGVVAGNQWGQLNQPSS